MSGREIDGNGGAVGAGVTFGLLIAWALHDAEEAALMPGWTRARVPELRDRFPQLPERMWQQLESLSGREFATAVAAMGCLMAAAAATAGAHMLARRLRPKPEVTDRR